MKKEDIRRTIRGCKAMLTEPEGEQEALDVFSCLEQSAAFALAERILMYNSLPDELPTRRFLEKWASRKHFFLPRVNGVNLEILPYDRTRLSLGAFHIEEPEGADTVEIDCIDMVVVPAVAYDARGNRVGRGKGFYDRLLRGCRAVKVGVGFSFQLVDEVPAEPHDVAMDMVIAGSRCIVVDKRRVSRGGGHNPSE